MKVVILATLWKNFVVAQFASYFERAHVVFFVGKYFVVRLSTMKTTKILPPEKYPLYGITTILWVYVGVIVYLTIIMNR